jgi:hypothetical protein
LYGDCALKDGLGVVISLLLQIPLDDGTYFPLNTHRLCDCPYSSCGGTSSLCPDCLSKRPDTQH